MKEDNSLVIFKIITNFVNELHTCFKTKYRPIKLYNQYLKHITLSDEKNIDKQLEIFKKFCIDNNEAIINKDLLLLKKEEGIFKVSEKVYIDMNEITKLSKDDKDIYNTICKYLLTLSAYLYPESNAKNILKNDNIKENKVSTIENTDDFLSNIISSINPEKLSSSNPLEAVSSLLPNILSSMNSNIENGNLDIGKLVGSMQKMLTNITKDIDPEELKKENLPIDLDMINNMLGTLSQNVKKT